MRSPRSPPLALLLLLLSGVVLGRVVRVPSGPLLRVEGTDISISCNVSEYEGPREQNFEWMYSSGAGPAVGVLSTWDNSFTHGSYMERVRSGGIQLQRKGNSEVLLQIHQLRATDEGNYSCSTPSTDATYSGNYLDQVQLKVIADTLRLHAPKGRRTSARNVTEGGSFQLPCQASFEDAATHVHLSLTWQRQSEGSISEVLTLTHLGRLQPGTKYAARYHAGELRVDTAASDTYQLTVDGAQRWDAGEYSCVANTWVQGADGWEKIQEKQVDVGRVEVRPIELKVSIEERSVVVPEGNPFTLTCLVSVDSSVPLITQVRWYHIHSGELHQVPSGPDPDPSTETTITHELLVPQAWNSKEYTCQASAWMLLRNGTWHRAAEGISPPVGVQVTHQASDLQVTLNISVAPHMAEEPLELWCHMSGAPHLSVSWYFTPSQEDPAAVTPVLVGSLHQDGSLQLGERYQQKLEKGELILSRRESQIFVLRIQWTSEEDRGSYYCSGTSWKQLHNQSWTPAAEEMSVPVSLFWVTKGIAWAQREVTIQEGPLYRTVGTHITIWCKVSGYQGPSKQNFQYSVYLPSAPDREVVMVSTQDPSLSYAKYNQRVRSGDILVERVTGDHTILHIRQLQELDTGEYECHTPNTDPKFYGSYSAKVNLTVLPDTLIVNMPHQELEKTEGSSLEVTCDVSKNSSRHTHLSVSLLLTSDKDFHILSLSRDFVLVPGEAFSERFTSGDIRMDKLSDTSYRLSIKALQLSDQGELFCQGSEWIEDPDGTWTKITEKKSEKTMLKVSALQGRDFKVQVESKDMSISMKSALEITCSVSGGNLIGSRFSVAWLLDGAVMATWDTSGVSSFGTPYRTREAKGQISVRRRDHETWTLRLNQVNEQDGGSYMCDVTEEMSKMRRQSTSVDISIKIPETAIRSVRLYSDVSELYEGDSVTLFCQVSGLSSSIDLTWLTKRPSGQWVEVATLKRDGEAEAAGEYVQRHKTGQLTVQRLSNGLHSLTLDSVVKGDGGPYCCRLTAWMQQPDDEWRNETSSSSTIQINVRPLGSTLEVVLMSRKQRVTSGDSASLFCRVKAQYSLRDKRLTWSWDFQPTSRSFQNLVNVYGNGSLSWEDSIPGFQGEAQLSIKGDTSTLTIYRVQRQHHQGAYRCTVLVRTRDASVPAASASYIMNVNVQLPDARLVLDTADRDMLVTGGQDEASVSCIIKAMTPGAVLHVGWFLLSPASPSAVNILNVTHEGLTSHHPSFSWFLSERVSPNTLVLHVLRPRLQESFYCVVREQLQESGEWVTLVEKTSGITRVVLSASDNTLKILKKNVSREVPAGGDVVLHCPLEEGWSAAALYSVSWYYQGPQLSTPSLVYRAGWEGLPEYKEELAGRLQVVSAVRGNYSLIMRSVGEEDAGKYYCQVEERRLQEDSWKMKASDTSGYLQLKVLAPEDRLTLNRTELTLIAAEGSNLTLPCNVVSTSVFDATFAITWWKVQTPGHQLLFNASRLGRFVYPSEEGNRLQYERTSELMFQLRILPTRLSDTGIYYCRIQEWLRTPRGVWYQLGQQSGGNMSVTIQAAGFHSHICLVPGLFYFLLVVLVFLLFLLVVLGWRLLTRWRNKPRSSSPRNENDFWLSVKTFEMKVEKKENAETDEAEQIKLCSKRDLSH